MESDIKIIDPADVATLLKKSVRWVYNHGRELGAVRIGKTWFFTEEGLEHAFETQRQANLAGSGRFPRKVVPQAVSNSTRGRGVGGHKAEGANEPGADLPKNRHGLRRVF